jgi:hypothetical protein
MAPPRKSRTAAAPARRQQDAPARSRARERIQAQQAAARRAGVRRRLLIAAGSVTAVLAAAGALVAVRLTSGSPSAASSEAAAPAAVTRAATTVPAGVLARASAGPSVVAPEPVRAAGAPLTAGGKPAIVFVSEESCPFCAAERWALVVALSRFGTWSHLGVTTSSATDIYPGTATFSFRAARYRSAQLTLRTTELADNAGRPLQPLTSLDNRLLGAYDIPPYVNSASQSGVVPFLDIANRYVLAGAQYDPQVLAGLSVTQIASQLRDPASPVAQAVDGSARLIVAAIRSVLDGPPARG